MTTTTPTTLTETANIHERVRERYAQAATQAASGTSACCSDDATVNETWGAVMYATDDLAVLPDAAVLASLGCGNPTALADLHPGETVLDLGSGGGIDVLLSARRVGLTGFAYGLDMTDEMLALAQENKAKAGATNVVFLKGQIEAVPLPANSVDVIISNCVVNLSPDKDTVLREAYRVLRPGGRVAISDVVVRDAAPGEGAIPDSVRRDMELWSGCIAGALEAREYREKLVAAGFTNVEIVEVRRYTTDDLGEGPESGITDAVASRFISAFVRATKPGALLTLPALPALPALVPLPMMVTTATATLATTATPCGCGTETVAVEGECCDDKAACCGEGSTCC